MTQSESLYDLVDKRDHNVVKAGLLTGAGARGGLSLVLRMNVSRSRVKPTSTLDSKVMC